MKGFDTMAKSKHYKVDNEKKIVYRYIGTNATKRDLDDIALYVQCGYEMRWVKAPLTVAKMRRELETLAPKGTLEAFNAAYSEKSTTTDFSETGFSKACKIYQDWKKSYNKAKKK